MAEEIAIVGAPAPSESEEPAAGMATVRLPLSALPEGAVAGSRGTASFVIDSVDGDAAEITISGIEGLSEEPAEFGSGESGLQGSLEAAMK